VWRGASPGTPAFPLQVVQARPRGSARSSRSLHRPASRAAAARQTVMSESRVVPVHLITGYCGAGKTHLLNLLLESCAASGKAAGVIAHRQNEEYGVETHPIKRELASTYDQMLDVGNGCVCCSPQGELTSILASLASPDAPRLDVLFIRCAPLAAPLIFAQVCVKPTTCVWCCIPPCPRGVGMATYSPSFTGIAGPRNGHGDEHGDGHGHGDDGDGSGGTL
jgi:hypothetical protein